MSSTLYLVSDDVEIAGNRRNDTPQKEDKTALFDLEERNGIYQIPSGGPFTIELQNVTRRDWTAEIEVESGAGGTITLDATTNSCTINGQASNMTITVPSAGSIKRATIRPDAAGDNFRIATEVVP